MSRPYSNFYADDIEEHADENWDDPDVLKALLDELEYRSTHRACVVKNKIQKRFKELSSPKGFKWPSTDAPASKYGYIDNNYWYKEGLLSFVGYHVGTTKGVRESIRRRLLDCVMHNDLPNVESPSYMKEWAKPRSTARLRKLADSLASFTRSAKRKCELTYSVAIEEWEADLEYLKETYYDESSGTYWPKT